MANDTNKGRAIKAVGKTILYDGVVIRNNKLKSFGKIIGALAGNDFVGVVESWYQEAGIVLVQLGKPVKVSLKKRYYAYVKISDVQLYEAKATSQSLKPYYAKTKDANGTVNVRLGNSTLSAIKSKVKNGSLIGESDGKDSNGFYKFNLATGGVGYASKDYVSTTQTIIKEIVKVEKVIEENPQTGEQKTVEQTTLDTGEGWTLKEVAINGGISAVIGFVVVKILTRIFK